MVGPSGGRVALADGTAIDVPAGAVDAMQQIGVSISTDAPPTGALTPLYHFEPDGIVFARPVTVTLPIPASAPTSTRLFWSVHGGAGFDELGGAAAMPLRGLASTRCWVRGFLLM